MTRRIAVVAFTLAAGCARRETPADTTGATLAAIDTLKAATVTMPVDSAAAAAKADSGSTTKSTGTKATPAPTRTPPTSTKRDTAHLGRDSVIMSNPRDPRRQIPTVPPTKKPD